MVNFNLNIFKKRKDFISFLKVFIILSLLGVLLIISWLYRMTSANMFNGAILALHKHPVGEVVIEGLSLSTTDESGRNVAIKAETVLKEEKNLITAQSINASLYIKRMKVDVSAQEGVVDLNTHLLKLNGNVQMKSDAGDMFECSNLDVFYSKNFVRSTSPLRVITKSTTINAGSLEIIENDVVHFGSGVQVEIANYTQ
ncbi:LPS export ABC transporter periplasmic protein LptC [Candidatus Lariskella endosymbiont of Epinotia ramella]|uniref:LPS export ABC transporter periplasmic protein LptC n=1 Tax=Candidatus Lariskella endosymbiont of Epinotia ramella TaxID=3066224 RepID=UPI0030D3C90D